MIHDNMKLKLWSIQYEHKLYELEKLGKLICVDPNFSEDMNWETEYKWMTKKLTKKVGSSNQKNQSPIWAWYQYFNTTKPKPDLRKSGYLPSGEKGIRIEFEKKISEVLLSDFILWHWPLSYKSYIAKNNIDRIRFKLKLNNLSLSNVSFKNLPKNIKAEIEESWNKIFDLNYEYKYYTDKRNEKMIQACLWEINKDEIIKIDKFVAK